MLLRKIAVNRRFSNTINFNVKLKSLCSPYSEMENKNSLLRYHVSDYNYKTRYCCPTPRTGYPHRHSFYPTKLVWRERRPGKYDKYCAWWRTPSLVTVALYDLPLRHSWGLCPQRCHGISHNHGSWRPSFLYVTLSRTNESLFASVREHIYKKLMCVGV